MSAALRLWNESEEKLKAKGNMAFRDVIERPQTYSSPAIIERRRRILQETRNVIGEQGISALSMNEIGQRAGVAKRTLYNAFQTRERMIAAAIQEYFDDVVSRIPFVSEPGTLRHNLERMVSVLEVSQTMRNYTRAILSLYFSSDVDNDIWIAMHSPARQYHGQWIGRLEAARQLQPWVKVDALADDLVRFEYATINGWAQGHIPDDQMIVRLTSGYLSCLLGSLRGATRREVETLIKDIGERGMAALPEPRKLREAA